MNRYALAIHGGAGSITQSAVTPDREREFLAALDDVLKVGQNMLLDGVSALEVVTQAIVSLEDYPLFNAGKGAVYNANKEHELDAAIMDGKDLRAGAVALVKTVKNPVLAAKALMEEGAHVFLAGQCADNFARQQGLKIVDSSYFHVEERILQLEKAQLVGGMDLLLEHDDKVYDSIRVFENPINDESKMGTVGAVACDIKGNIAAASSTGGLTNKVPGRIGDTPCIGAGLYADNGSAAVATTGTGETFIRCAVAHDICALVKYAGLSLDDAAQTVLKKQQALGGSGGLIAVNAKGEIAMPFTTDGMYRGAVSSQIELYSAIYR